MDPVLEEAITSGNIAQLRQLFATKNDVSEYLVSQSTATHQNTPLHVAVQHKKKKFVEEICKRCSQPEILIMKQNSEGDTALHIAARLGLSGTVAFLIRHMDACGIDSGMVQELKDNNGKNFLHVAAENGSVKVIKYILRKSNSVETVINGVDNKGNTPLHLVLKSKSVRCVRILSRDKRVNKKAVNNENLTALHILLRDHQLMLTDAQEEFFKKGYKYLSTEGGWLCCGSLWCGKRIKVDKSNDKYEAMADEKIMKLEQSANKMASRQVLISLLMVCVIT